MIVGHMPCETTLKQSETKGAAVSRSTNHTHPPTLPSSVTQYLGSGLITGAVFASGVRSFPQQRGLLTGLIKGWVGLCGGMVTQALAKRPAKKNPPSARFSHGRALGAAAAAKLSFGRRATGGMHTH